MNIMVMAGTKDARHIIRKLSSLNNDLYLIATTITDYGAQLALKAGANEVIQRKLPQKEIEKIIKKRKIKILIDATHPYAVEATINAVKATENQGILFVRYERPEIPIPENNLLHVVEGFQEATDLAQKINQGNVLHLAGVNTLHYLTDTIEKEKIFVRIIPSLDSIERCRELGILTRNIIAMQGTFSQEFNQILVQEYGISLILTKESGKTGGFYSKVRAALQLNIPVIIIKRPLVIETQKKDVFNNIGDLISFIEDKIDSESV